MSATEKVRNNFFPVQKPLVNFANVLQAAFTCKDPKSAKDTDDFTVFLHYGIFER